MLRLEVEQGKLWKSRSYTNYAAEVLEIYRIEKHTREILFSYLTSVEKYGYECKLDFHFLVAVVHWSSFLSHLLKQNVLVELRLPLGATKQFGCLFVIKEFLAFYVIIFIIFLLISGLQIVRFFVAAPLSTWTCPFGIRFGSTSRNTMVSSFSTSSLKNLLLHFWLARGVGSVAFPFSSSSGFTG